MKHTDDVDEGNESKVLSNLLVGLSEVKLLENCLHGVEREPGKSECRMDIKRTVVTSHTDRCIVEPSELGTFHTDPIESSWVSEETVDERSGECKVANETWH